MTSVEVKTSKFSSDHYLQVKRHGEYDRWINVNRSSWIKLKGWVNDIDQALANRDEHTFDLYKTKQGSQKALVTFYNGDPYVGIHLFDQNGVRCRGKGLNLTMEEWQKLKETMDEIDAAMMSLTFPKEWEYPDTSRNFYKAYVKTFKGETRHVEGWSIDYPEMQKPKTGCYFMIQETDKALPDAADLLVKCYSYFVNKCVQSLIKCDACELDRPSQIDHIDGCLLGPTTALEQYGDEARNAVDISAVAELYKKVRKYLYLAPAVGDFNYDAYLKSATVTPYVDDLFKDVFRELC